MGDFLYISNMKNLLKNIFGKKEVTKEDKVVNLIVKFIKSNYQIKEVIGDQVNTVSYYSNDMWPPTVFYYRDNMVTYSRAFAQDIHDFISDDRLIQPDSELMGEVFKKLYKRKVHIITGYSVNGTIV